MQDQAKEAYEQGDFEEALKFYRMALPSARGKERQLLLSNIVACRLNVGGSAQAEAAVENAKQVSIGTICSKTIACVWNLSHLISSHINENYDGHDSVSL